MSPSSLQLKNRNFSFVRFYQRYGVFLLLILVCTVCSFLHPRFLTRDNMMNILKQVCVICTLALGELIIILTGACDMAAGSMVAFAGVVAADIMVKTNSVFLACIGGLMAGAITGYITGRVVTTLNLPPFIIGLAMLNVVRGLAQAWCNCAPIPYLGDFAVIGQGYIGPIPICVIVVFVLCVLTWLLLNKTKLGRYLYATGGNIECAKVCGIDTNKIRTYAYMLSGILAAAGGIIMASRQNSGQPTAGQGYEFKAITAAVIGGAAMNGGAGNVGGVVIGAIIAGVVDNILNLMGISSFYQTIASGLTILIAVIIDVQVRQAAERT